MVRRPSLQSGGRQASTVPGAQMAVNTFLVLVVVIVVIVFIVVVIAVVIAVVIVFVVVCV